jgi:hypothetical protein
VCDGVEASLGLRTVDATGRAQWEIATNDGGVLPHGAADVAALAGCTVEVRDGDTGDALLFGTIPELPAAVATGGAGGDEARARGRATLVRTTDGTGKGYVELRRRVKDGEVRQRFKVEAEGQSAGASLDVFAEDPSNPGTPAFVATVVVDAFGEARARASITHDGALLPFGATDVTAFVGLTVEVRRSSDGVVLLRGAAPSLVAD